jgi:Protein of unknown function (DUF3551)
MFPQAKRLEGTVMKILVALLTTTLLTMAVCALASTAASAQGASYCARGCDFGSGDCSYSSYQQCQASVSGRVGWCDANPYVRTVSDPQLAVRAKYSRRRL